MPSLQTGLIARPKRFRWRVKKWNGFPAASLILKSSVSSWTCRTPSGKICAKKSIPRSIIHLSHEKIPVLAGTAKLTKPRVAGKAPELALRHPNSSDI